MQVLLTRTLGAGSTIASSLRLPNFISSRSKESIFLLTFDSVPAIWTYYKFLISSLNDFCLCFL